MIYTAQSNEEGVTFRIVDKTDYSNLPAPNPSEGVSQKATAPVISKVLPQSKSGESALTAPELVADTQHVYVSESTTSEDGTQVTVKLSYLVDDPTLTGVGFTPVSYTHLTLPTTSRV